MTTNLSASRDSTLSLPSRSNSSRTIDDMDCGHERKQQPKSITLLTRIANAFAKFIRNHAPKCLVPQFLENWAWKKADTSEFKHVPCPSTFESSSDDIESR